MSGSKKRPLWAELPERVRGDIEALVGGAVARAENCRVGSRRASLPA
ncbi:MAG TPA: hypothetical protein VES42_07990 [Pilimelia sp.]|nr:hypothetical protein [Pilimelia sp.]